MQPRLNNKIGARILSEANDLKRTPHALALELGYNLDYVLNVLAGNESTDNTIIFAKKMAQIYPVKLNDLLIDLDDSSSGVTIFRSAPSKSSSRIFERENSQGIKLPYYEYRDTAMSRLSPFRPEWITPLVTVNDNSPDNQAVVYNRGHLLHQTTFFVGQVNFYWQINGKSYVKEMNTGDSNIITPFYPHSFASRDANNLGLIIACTYAGSFKKSLNELSLLKPGDLDVLAGNFSTPALAFRSKLNRYLASESLNEKMLADRLKLLGCDSNTALNLASGAKFPDLTEVKMIASILNISHERLLGPSFKSSEAIVNKIYNPEMSYIWPNSETPQLRFTPLARSIHQPLLKSFSIEVMCENLTVSPTDWLTHGLFEYVYNYGSEDVLLFWDESHTDILHPGDSAVINPMTKHAFAPQKYMAQSGIGGKLYVVRAPGLMTEDALDEYGKFCLPNRDRSLFETKVWY
jgi:hypothetical protein